MTTTAHGGSATTSMVSLAAVQYGIGVAINTSNEYPGRLEATLLIG